MTWLAWLVIVLITTLVSFGWGYTIALDLERHRQVKRLQRWENELVQREERVEEREAGKRVVTTLKVHEQSHGRPIYIKPTEDFLRAPSWWTS